MLMPLGDAPLRCDLGLLVPGNVVSRHDNTLLQLANVAPRTRGYNFCRSWGAYLRESRSVRAGAWPSKYCLKTCREQAPVPVANTSAAVSTHSSCNLFQTMEMLESRRPRLELLTLAVAVHLQVLYRTLLSNLAGLRRCMLMNSKT
jgi:hypothetical protein